MDLESQDPIHIQCQSGPRRKHILDQKTQDVATPLVWVCLEAEKYLNNADWHSYHVGSFTICKTRQALAFEVECCFQRGSIVLHATHDTVALIT